MSPTGYYYINVIKTRGISRFGHLPMQIRLHSSPLHAKQVDDKVLTQPEYFRIPRSRVYTHTHIHTHTHTHDKIVCRVKYCICSYSDTSSMIIIPKSFTFSGLLLELVSQYLTSNKMPLCQAILC